MRSLIAVLAVFAFVHIKDVLSSTCHCNVQYEPVGCYGDNKGSRAMGEYIMSERDNTVSVWNHHWVDWKNWDNYMGQLACRCAAVAQAKGHKYFGLQFYGECWSSADAEGNYDKYGESWEMKDDANGKRIGCMGPGFKQCNKNMKTHCVGREITNMVYKISDGCFDKVVSVGCFRDKSARAMPDYFSNDRDKSINNFSGIRINWFWYDSYMINSLLCRCAEMAKAKGYKVFGLQYYGECWGGMEALDTYFKYSDSSNCLDPCFSKCKSSSHFCVGKHYANYVYRFSLDVAECAVKHEEVGCRYAPALTSGRLLISDDPESPVFSGYPHLTIPPIAAAERLPELSCSCAFKAKEKNFPYYGMLTTGECYGLTDSDLRPESSSCYGDYDNSAPCNGDQCGGAPGSIWVVKLTGGAKKREFSETASEILEEMESL